MSSPLNPLSKSQQEFCTYSGVFGTLITATCLVQQLAFVRANWITNLMILPYLLMIVSFVLLALQKAIAPLLLIISTVISFAIALLWLAGGSFSLVVIILLLYCSVITVFIYAEQIQTVLRRKQEAERAEEMKWRGKI
ncbi:MAG: hypothetical protein HZA79_02580 [Sphingobacteriales bacterium]|nr:hypothetical protein [Sphingobacteriales bacterium]